MSDTAAQQMDLRSNRFRKEREASWQELEALIAKAETRGPTGLSDAELLKLPRLYRACVSGLSMARAISLDRELIVYLENLATRGYFYVYGTRSTFFERVGQFFARDWPLSVQKLWRETLLAFLITVLCAATSFTLVMHSPDWFFSFMSEGMSQGRTPDTSVETLREGLYKGSWKDSLSLFATYLFTHNARIGIFAFALGFMFGLPTLFLLAQNGFMLGAFLAVYFPKGLGYEITGWLMIHGTTELFAIFLAGGAGFHIGWKLAFPGEMTRMQAASQAGRTAANVVIGVVIMLLIAGLLEGFGRQLVKADWARYVIGLSMLAFWVVYFYWPRPSLTEMAQEAKE